MTYYMGSASSPLCHGPHKSSCRRSPSCPSVHRAHIERRRRATIVMTCHTVIVTVATAITAIEESWNHLNPEPYHTSFLSGRQWVQDLLNDHRNRMKDSLGTPAAVFRRLEEELVHAGGLR
ncbi:hypothetical protein BD311DRAFT_347958 [Dichomitus squalens]|uniref:DUF8040 domain-containing protein n=3 Tax=Dichomitus squalens TaxID=114155 RepID=A0A4Q9N4R2_9APHY|nr:hypothetical protein BD311DRAFT_347958 [Dichomitus squalens]